MRLTGLVRPLGTCWIRLLSPFGGAAGRGASALCSVRPAPCVETEAGTWSCSWSASHPPGLHPLYELEASHQPSGEVGKLHPAPDSSARRRPLCPRLEPPPPPPPTAGTTAAVPSLRGPTGSSEPATAPAGAFSPPGPGPCRGMESRLDPHLQHGGCSGPGPVTGVVSFVSGRSSRGAGDTARFHAVLTRTCEPGRAAPE